MLGWAHQFSKEAEAAEEKKGKGWAAWEERGKEEEGWDGEEGPRDLSELLCLFV